VSLPVQKNTARFHKLIQAARQNLRKEGKRGGACLGKKVNRDRGLYYNGRLNAWHPANVMERGEERARWERTVGTNYGKKEGGKNTTRAWIMGEPVSCPCDAGWLGDISKEKRGAVLGKGARRKKGRGLVRRAGKEE